MKIIFLNIFEGCQEKDRFDAVIHFVIRENPDVLGLSELYGWDKNNFAKLKTFLERTHFRHHVFKKSRNDFHLGLFSKYRLNHPVDISEGIGMAKIKANITLGSTSFLAIVSHLSHLNEDIRLKEVEIILEHIKSGERIILMGDFNSLSPFDKYNESELLLLVRNMGIEKFGVSKLRKEVIQKIIDFGLIDAVKKQHPKTFSYSVPTTYNKDKNHFAMLRLDYLFITKNLLDNLQNARIFRNKETNRLSDHFPVAAEFVL